MPPSSANSPWSVLASDSADSLGRSSARFLFPQCIVSMSGIKERGMKTSTQLIFRAFESHEVGGTGVHSLGMAVVLLGTCPGWGGGPAWGDGQPGMGAE